MDIIRDNSQEDNHQFGIDLTSITPANFGLQVELRAEKEIAQQKIQEAKEKIAFELATAKLSRQLSDSKLPVAQQLQELLARKEKFSRGWLIIQIWADYSPSYLFLKSKHKKINETWFVLANGDLKIDKDDSLTKNIQKTCEALVKRYQNALTDSTIQFLNSPKTWAVVKTSLAKLPGIQSDILLKPSQLPAGI